VGFKVRGEVPEKRGFVCEPHAFNVFALPVNLKYYFNQIIDVALGIYATWHSQTDEIHLGGSCEHECSDFNGTDSAFEVEFSGEGDAGELIGWDVREEGASVYIDGVATGRLDDGDSASGDVVAEVGGGGDAVAEVILLEGLLNADGDGFEIASGESAVGWVAFGEDEEIFFLLGEDVVVGAEEPADVGHAVFFG